MNENQLRELFKTNEANKTMEATFYETQKSLALIAKQAKLSAHFQPSVANEY